MCSEWNANLDATLSNFKSQKFDEDAKDDARHYSSNMYKLMFRVLIISYKIEININKELLLIKQFAFFCIGFFCNLNSVGPNENILWCRNRDSSPIDMLIKTLDLGAAGLMCTAI